METEHPKPLGQLKKRRRDRDRTQANPTAPYSPNKRALLSYDDSDVEDAQAPYLPSGPLPEPQSNPHIAAFKSGTQMAEQDDGEDMEDDEGFDLAETYGVRMLNADSEDREVILAKHATPALDPATYHGAFDPMYGQHNVLPFADADELDGWNMDEAPQNGLEYLKSVRSERETIPNLLIADDFDEDAHDDGWGDECGYWDEDAYIGPPYTDPDAPAHVQSTQPQPQEAYHNALKKRFVGQRACLAEPAWDHESAKIDQNHPYFCPTSERDEQTWVRWLHSTVPHPMQVRSMKYDTVLTLLELTSTYVLLPRKNVSPSSSAWVWALLARLPDVGQMDNDQVATVRELGKRVLAHMILWQDQGSAQTVHPVGASHSITGAERLHSADASTTANTEVVTEEAELETKSVITTDETTGEELVESENTMATLDMILTIVGELFGQRDLLASRPMWCARSA